MADTMAEKYKKMSYQQRLRIYESKKTQIWLSCTSCAEYDRKIRALCKELGI